MENISERTRINLGGLDLKIPLTISPWLKELLVDPISKKPFTNGNQEYFKAPCGFEYKRIDGVPDLRIRLSKGGQEWTHGQLAFEEWIDGYFHKGESDPEFYQREQQGDAPIYEALKLKGRVLDVGGLLGTIRKYMQADQEYCSIDPFISVIAKATNKKNLFRDYPMKSPLNFIGGFAEFLPLKDSCFDTINMRSCLDHFYNPEIALLEAYRVLKDGGRLIIGISLHGRTVKSKTKEALRSIVGLFIDKYRDHHIWHPSYDGLIELCNSCGFEIDQEVWQTADILYASFLRRKSHFVTFR